MRLIAKVQVTSRACPLLVPLIEEGLLDDRDRSNDCALSRTDDRRWDRYARARLHALSALARRSRALDEGSLGRFRTELRLLWQFVGRENQAHPRVRRLQVALTDDR